MPRNPWPAQWPEGSRAHVQEFDVDPASTYLFGALVLLDADEELVECGADPAVVLGVAADPAVMSPGLGETSIKRRVFVADQGTLFAMYASAALSQDNLDQPYGVVKTSNVWLVDLAETTADVVRIVRIVQQGNEQYALVRFVQAVRQLG